MKCADIKYDNIFHPDEAFQLYKNNLINLYVDSYGVNNENIIKDRINSTIYLFESNPIDKMKYANDHINEISSKMYDNITEEYLDYCLVKEYITKIIYDKYYDEFATIFKASHLIREEDLFNCDFSSFSSINQNKLKDKKIPIEFKKYILERRQKYLNFCSSNNLYPVIDNHIVDYMSDLLYEMNYSINKYIFLNSKWGKKIKQSILASSVVSISNKNFVKMLFESDNAATYCFFDRGYYNVVCHFPVIELTKVNALDRIFFHECRHVVEFDNGICGIDELNSKYVISNEINTEKNAIMDTKKMYEYPLFSNDIMNSGISSSYEKLFPFAGEFFDENKNILNQICFNNDISKLHFLFGEENFSEYNKYLTDIYNARFYSDEIKDLPVDTSKSKQLLYRLKDSFQSRQ